MAASFCILIHEVFTNELTAPHHISQATDSVVSHSLFCSRCFFLLPFLLPGPLYLYLVLSSLPLFMFSISLFHSLLLSYRSILYSSPVSSCSFSFINRPFYISYFHIVLFYSSSSVSPIIRPFCFFPFHTDLFYSSPLSYCSFSSIIRYYCHFFHSTKCLTYILNK